MLEENNKTWYNTNEKYNSLHDAAETIDNYQEQINPPTVVGNTDITDPIIKHIEPCIHQGDQHTDSLKSTISTPDSGYQFLHSMLYKVIFFMLFCTFKARVTTCKTIVYVIDNFSDVVISTPITMYDQFNKPHIRHKTSNGSGEFFHNLCASKKSCYNKQNCKSGKYGCRHTFMKYKSRTKRVTIDNSNQDLKIKGRKLGTFKSPPPRRLNSMPRAIDSWANRQYINFFEHFSLLCQQPKNK